MKENYTNDTTYAILRANKEALNARTEQECIEKGVLSLFNIHERSKELVLDTVKKKMEER